MRQLCTKDSEYGTFSWSMLEGRDSTIYTRYLPQGTICDKVLELSYIEAEKKGDGHVLMQQFLALLAVSDADVIVLEATWNVSGRKTPFLSNSEYVDYLVKFYEVYGFKVGKTYSRGSKMMYKLKSK